MGTRPEVNVAAIRMCTFLHLQRTATPVAIWGAEYTTLAFLDPIPDAYVGSGRTKRSHDLLKIAYLTSD